MRVNQNSGNSLRAAEFTGRSVLPLVDRKVSRIQGCFCLHYYWPNQFSYNQLKYFALKKVFHAHFGGKYFEDCENCEKTPKSSILWSKGQLFGKTTLLFGVFFIRENCRLGKTGFLKK